MRDDSPHAFEVLLLGSFRDDLKHLTDRVDASLSARLDQCADTVPMPLLHAMRYSLLAPGKRLRPLLVLLAARAAGGSEEMALPAACAVEMIHTYSLIHDDLPAMDDDDLRRGRPTCHKMFGEAMAILAGDALLTLAFEVIAESYPPAIAAVCSLESARGAGAGGMVGGQVLDLAAEGRPGFGPIPSSLSDLENIHRRKTGALFRTSLRLGGLTAAASPTILNCLTEFGHAFGLLFQITDDLLDVESTSSAAGKRTGKDAERGKLTYPGLLGVERARELAAMVSRTAVDAVRPLGEAAEPLVRLALLVVERDR